MSFWKAVKRPIRKVGVRLGLLKDWDTIFAIFKEPGRQRDEGFYNQLYEFSGFDIDYNQSDYYFLWTVLTDRILHSEGRRILEVGCGPGHFAALLRDQGIEEYLGFDFSPRAIELARKLAPGVRFEVADVFDTELFDSFSSDWIVCLEVLEHVEEDLKVVERFPLGVRCLCSVPNFPASSHVRHFSDVDEVRRRYEPFFEHLEVLPLRGVRHDDEIFFLMDGIRSAVA